MLDADERVTWELFQEIAVKVGSANATSLFRVRRKDMFRGRWLRRSSGYPTWFGRLVRPERVEVVREVNEEYVTDGEVGYLENHLLHFPFNKGLAWWFERHNRYSTMEAELVRSVGQDDGGLAAILSRDPSRRRRALKRLSYRLPGRPLLVATYLYLLRGGFLDGSAGLSYVRLRYTYERMIDVKVAERSRRQTNLPL